LLERGVMTLGDLAQLDADASRELLGSRGPLFVERARGQDGRLVDGTRPPRSLAREVTLAEATLDEARLVSVLDHVCDTLSARLRHMGWFAHTVTVRLQTDEAPDPRAAVTRSTTLREATARHDALLSTARALFRVLWRHRAVVRVGVVLSNLQQVGPQMPLFPLSERGSGDDLASLRTRQGLRSLVEGRYLEHQRRRRAG
jgi:nucleotidyltransferase/DNA polymerase involved in DNA repair